MRTLFIVLACAATAAADGDWDPVAGPGIDNVNNVGITALREWGSYLYIGTENPTSGCRIYRTTDGVTFTAVMTGGFGAGHTKITEFEDFGGMLYAGTANPAGGQVFRTSDGTTWTAASTPGFGTVTNVEVTALEDFAGKLWVGTRNVGGTGGAVWNSSDGTTYASVTTTGFGDAGNNAINDLETDGTSLYATTSNSAGGELWRLTSGGSATVLIDDGFGTSDNNELTAIEIYYDELFVGTRNAVRGYQIWSSVDDVTFFERVKDGFDDANNFRVTELDNFGPPMYVCGESNGGEPFEMYRTFSGGGYNQEDADGFGDPGNFRINDVAAFAGKVWGGTSNPAGGGLYQTELPVDSSTGTVIVDSDGGHSRSRWHCYVATAAYGSPAASRVAELRRIRDTRVEACPAGRDFTSLYRKTAPPGAAVLARSEVLRAIVRKVLIP